MEPIGGTSAEGSISFFKGDLATSHNIVPQIEWLIIDSIKTAKDM
jgi:hypothetical protein